MEEDDGGGYEEEFEDDGGGYEPPAKSKFLAVGTRGSPPGRNGRRSAVYHCI